MRCRVGDICLILRGHPRRVGKLCEVIGPARRPDCDWSVTVFNDPGPSLGARDHELRPIRDNDGQDETIAWAGRPQELPIKCITALREMS